MPFSLKTNTEDSWVLLFCGIFGGVYLDKFPVWAVLTEVWLAVRGEGWVVWQLLTASKAENLVCRLRIQEGHGKRGERASQVVKTLSLAPEEMQGNWFSLKERCLQGNPINSPVHMRVIKETDVVQCVVKSWMKLLALGKTTKGMLAPQVSGTS